MTNDDSSGSALSESKVNEVAKNVVNADDLLKLAQAKQIFERLERTEKKAFPWESVLKFSSVTIGALVGAVILVTSGITDNFWDAYNFAKEAKTARESELATIRLDLDTAKTKLERLRSQLSQAEMDKEAAEAERVKAEGQKAAAIEQRDSALAEIEAARTGLIRLEKEAELARISSIRMYLCDRDFAIALFDDLSRYHGWPNFNAAVANVPSPAVYISVQFIGDNSFQYISNIRSEDRLMDSRIEFGRWQPSPSSVEMEFTMSKRGRQTEIIAVERFSRGELAAYARGDRDKVCSEEGTCFHRNSTCRPEAE